MRKVLCQSGKAQTKHHISHCSFLRILLLHQALLEKWTLPHFVPIMDHFRRLLPRSNFLASARYRLCFIPMDCTSSDLGSEASAAIPGHTDRFDQLRRICDGMVKPLTSLKRHWVRGVSRQSYSPAVIVPLMPKRLRIPVLKFRVPRHRTIVRHSFIDCLDWIAKLTGYPFLVRDIFAVRLIRDQILRFEI